MSLQTEDFLVELGTAELPPKALVTLAKAFQSGIEAGLKSNDLAFESAEFFATPRRLVVRVNDLVLKQPDQKIDRKGPAVKAAFDADGNPTKAAMGFAKSCGVEDFSAIGRTKTDKGEWLSYTVEQQGKPTSTYLADIVQQSLDKLPIPKRMRWGDRTSEFVRPVRWLLMIHGSEVVPATIMEIESSNQSWGHRFHSEGPITIANPKDYETQLKKEGFVVVDVEERKTIIREQVEAAAEALSGKALIDPDLLDEVSALNEWPVAVSGGFDESFLDVPSEALISSMQDHQRYFPVLDSNGKLKAKFITVANLQSNDEQVIREGNERVIRPRLADAEFFWSQDKKKTLEDRFADLENILFQKKLGSTADKVRRVESLAGMLAESLGVASDNAKRAAHLSKCDLVSQMVLEFPELQGTMGRYYAEIDGEPEEVSHAVEQHYWPRNASDNLPEQGVAQSVALADRIDTLLGIFSVGQQPTGTKDPFGLRRAAIAVLKIIIEKKLPIDLKAALEFGAKQLPAELQKDTLSDDVFTFVLDRLKTYYQDQGVETLLYDAVRALSPVKPYDFQLRVDACQSFLKLPEAVSLAAANKRVGNILKKAKGDIPDSPEESLLQDDAEKALWSSLSEAESQATKFWEANDYTQFLATLAQLKAPVDSFFDQVMVNVEDDEIRLNRLAMLAKLRSLFLRVADLSVLST